MKNEFDGRTTAALGLALILLPATAVAEEATNSSDASTVLDRIEVTSRKRTEALREVPASIALVEGEQLAHANAKQRMIVNDQYAGGFGHLDPGFIRFRGQTVALFEARTEG